MHVIIKKTAPINSMLNATKTKDGTINEKGRASVTRPFINVHHVTD